MTVDVSGPIRRFVGEEILFQDPGSVSPDHVLIPGAMDSLALVRLVAFLEEEFGVEIDEAELTAEHFRTVGAIERFAASKTERAPAG